MFMLAVSVASMSVMCAFAAVSALVRRSPYPIALALLLGPSMESVPRPLRNGQCLGIFPEGGSHDRTDLLPLKAGVVIIALEAYSKHYITVPIVPVGLNYFHGHRFGGRVVIEFGPPIVVPEQIHLQHKTDKRGSTMHCSSW